VQWQSRPQAAAHPNFYVSSCPGPSFLVSFVAIIPALPWSVLQSLLLSVLVGDAAVIVADMATCIYIPPPLPALQGPRWPVH
jgi:hypothetical protein